MTDNSILRLNPECIKCLLNKYLNKLPCEMDEDTKTGYFQKLLEIISRAPKSTSAPEIVAEVERLQKAMFGKSEDYSEIKRYFNGLMLSKEKGLTAETEKADDGFRLAMCYSMLGNYIDFGAMASVEESKLNELFAGASDIKFDENEYVNLKNDLERARKVVFLADNCGEIALDKVFLKRMQKDYPQIELQIIVRGAPVLNDATMEDAMQVGLDEIATVIGNGSDIAGTCLDKISEKARGIIDEADVIIAKGQGNFETMRYCGKNVYYMFLCKCQLFADRCNVPRFSPMLLNDLRMN